MKFMKSILLILTFLLVLPLLNVKVAATNQVQIYFFYDIACAHCYEEGLYLDQMEAKYDNLTITRYEITSSTENNQLFEDVKVVFSNESSLTPYTVIGGVALSGFNSQTESDIEKLIVRYSSQEYVDIFQKMLNEEEILPGDFDTINFEDGDTVNLPLIGPVRIDQLSLGVAAVVIGFVDGFNPCAMWVLIFLITMLIQQKDKKKMWILGVTFLFASALMYFLFMVAWLNIAVQITTVVWIRFVIGIFALSFGGYHVFKFIKDSRKKDVGCEVTDETQKRKIFDRVKKVVTEQKMIIALLGIIALAVSVNLVELACSAGLPLLFTQILAYNNLPVASYYGYIGIYIFFFLIDDLVVFAIAMITFQVSGISNKYSRLSTIIGGIIMLIIVFLLLFFPDRKSVV